MDKEIPFLFDTDTVLEIQRQERELLFQAIKNDKSIEKNLDDIIKMLSGLKENIGHES